jgi:hypothetical protein
MRAGDRRNPLTKDLLRGPGESLREQIDEMTSELAGNFALSLTPLLWAYASYVSAVAYADKVPGAWVAWVLGGISIAAQAVLVSQIWRLLKARRSLTLGFEAELAVGQELNELARQGFHVFHDVPVKRSNVDHIVVGSNGVFAIETKGRAKPRHSSAKPAHEVQYDGAILQFPGWRESDPLEQAKYQAKWVGEWLSSAVGEPVKAHPVLVLPGWFVKTTKPGGIPVLAAPNIVKYVPRMTQGPRLDEGLIKRVVFQLDQRCRNVAPRVYEDRKSDERR